MKILKYNFFIERNIPIGTQNNAGRSGGISTHFGPVGPNYGSSNKLRNTFLNTDDTEVIFNDIDGKIYTFDEYQDLYQNYLKNNGKPLSGFNKDNLLKVLELKN